MSVSSINLDNQMPTGQKVVDIISVGKLVPFSINS